MNHRSNHFSRRAVGVGVLCAYWLLSGCAHNPNERFTAPEQLYDEAKQYLDQGSYDLAIKDYEQLTARFPFSNVARQGRFDLMYAYYKSGERESAIDLADQFIRENPTHPRVDYAYYMKGLVNFERTRYFLERWFKVDLSARPPSDALSSFQAFQTLVQRFPHSPYALDARQRMIALRNRLADYEIYVARYYMKRGVYIGALNRAKTVIENYDGAPAMSEALKITQAAYNALGMDDLAQNIQRVLKLNESVAQVDAAK